MARESKKNTGGIRWRLWLGILALAAVTGSTAMGALRLRRFVIADPQFQLSHRRPDALTIEGLRYASRSKVQRVFAADFDRSVFLVPLDERRRRLLAIDWVEDASVSRVWPDRLMVRIRERRPVAFVYLRSGVLLVDALGVLLDPPAQASFAFPVLSGVREDETEADRSERVRALLRLEDSMGYLMKDISEVDTSDPDDLRVVANVDRSAVSLLLGDANFGRRYQNFVTHYPDIEKQSPGVKTFDLRLDDRITAKD
jgi:cell division protein FtsQ